jgi:formylglycine-generating enzyme required for sulfatase activity/uncharacterized caspase-like protein
MLPREKKPVLSRKKTANFMVSAMNGNITRIIFCFLLLVIFGVSDAIGASKNERGVQVIPKPTSAFDNLYNQSYAVIIGVNAYEKWPSLEYAVKDAQAMEQKLKSMGFQTITMLNQHATKENILKVLGDDLPKQVQKDDRIVIFFAGHGQTEELSDGTQMGYIIPVDADTRNIFSTAISMDQVRVFSRRLRAKHVLYLIDSCYAGLGLSRSGVILPSEQDYLRKITTRKAHQMLTAGGKGELAHEEGGHGIFTKYVLEALDGAADRDEKRYITFSDMASYVKPKVSRYTETKQIPQYGNIDGEGEFVFVLKGPTDATQPDVLDLDKEHQRLAEEKKRLEADIAVLAAQKAKIEEQERLEEEIARLAAQKVKMEKENRVAEEQRRVEEEKAVLVKKAKEEEQRKISAEQERIRLEVEQPKRKAREEAEKAKKDVVPVIVPSISRGTSREITRDGRFIAYDNGTVMDTKTNLMWAEKDNGSDISWQLAKSYCDNYQGGGYTDWRMPTQDELEGLYDIDKSCSVVCSSISIHVATGLIDFSCFGFWASEERGTESARFYFNLGVKLWYPQWHNNNGRVLPVRSITETSDDKKADMASVQSAPPPVAENKMGDVYREPKTGMELVFIKGGCFKMGDVFEEGGADERPVHEVCVNDFYIGKYEVTVGQFKKFVAETGYRMDVEKKTDGKNGCWAYDPNDKWDWNYRVWANWKTPFKSQENQDEHPVSCISWNDAKAFADWIAQKNGKAYRLPTEAEWEYAARAGTVTRYYWGDGAKDACIYANVADNTRLSGGETWDKKINCIDGYTFVAPVGKFRPNNYGLYDMIGNVWELVQDGYEKIYYSNSPRNNPVAESLPVGSRCVMRGGGYTVSTATPAIYRTSNRGWVNLDTSSSHVGFRLARTVATFNSPVRKSAPDSGVKENAKKGRFIAYDNGIALDTKANLMWAVKNNGKDINWANAKSYGKSCCGGGYTD